jgi:polyisoprenyl-phosphate glycosyltransferase
MVAPTLSIVAPAYNEERNLQAFLQALIPVLDKLGEPFEVIFVNDGSRDNTLGLLAAASVTDPRIKVVSLARNFGKDVALSAGLAHAGGRAVIPIDCDLQHPPELIPELVARWRSGAEMVLAVRAKRDEEGWARRTSARLYYRLMRMMTSVEIPPNAGDFRLIDRKIVDVINRMPERCRFMKGIFAWPGFTTATVEFQANTRADGATRWSFFKLWSFALDGLFSFSTAPLKIWTYIGLGCAVAAFLYLVEVLIEKEFFGIAAPGYASLLVVLLFFNGLSMLSNGIQGEYLARIFDEVKGRPLYVVGATFGFDAATTAEQATRASTAVTAPMPALPLPTHPPSLPPADAAADLPGPPRS